VSDIAKIGGFALTLLTAMVVAGMFIGGNMRDIEHNTQALKDMKDESREDRKMLVKLLVLMGKVNVKVSQIEKSQNRANQK